MKRTPLSPEAKAAAIARLNEVMRRFCEDVERRKADQATERAGRLCDEMGPNV
jgi:hypothetical protein